MKHITYDEYYDKKYEQLEQECITEQLELDGTNPSQDDVDDYIYSSYEEFCSEMEDCAYEAYKDAKMEAE